MHGDSDKNIVALQGAEVIRFASDCVPSRESQNRHFHFGYNEVVAFEERHVVKPYPLFLFRVAVHSFESMDAVHCQDKAPKPPASAQHEQQSYDTKHKNPDSGRGFFIHKRVPPAPSVLRRSVRAEDWPPPPRGLKKQTRATSPEAGRQSSVCF